MHKFTTKPLLTHFLEDERAKLVGTQGEAVEVIGQKPSETLIVRTTVNMVLDNPKLRRQLIRRLRASAVVVV